MSSIIVYGESKSLKPMVIAANTVPIPTGFYGDSKLQAENGILPLQSENFDVTVLRLPMVYGNGCKGNFARLEKLAVKWSLYPNFPNQRSMLYIENLCRVLQHCAENPKTECVFPQNPDYVSTIDLIDWMAQTRGKRIVRCKGTGWTVRLAALAIPEISKLFGSLLYDKVLSGDILPICSITTKQSVEKTFGDKNSGSNRSGGISLPFK